MSHFVALNANQINRLQTMLAVYDKPAPEDHYGHPARGYVRGMITAAQAACDAMLQANATDPYVPEWYDAADAAFRDILELLCGGELGRLVKDVAQEGDHIVTDAMRWLVENAEVTL